LYSTFYGLDIIGGVITLLCSILPDIDKFNSKISKKTFPFSLAINIIRHRGILHSLFPLILILFIPEYSVFALLGYSSHLMLDLISGKMKLFIVGPRIGVNIRLVEKPLFYLLTIINVYLGIVLA
jgi:membrane-bound metal-dependent hydrolase YbcI (DUF457 family)